MFLLRWSHVSASFDDFRTIHAIFGWRCGFVAQLWRLKKKCGAEINFWRGGALRSGAKWGMEVRLVKVEGQRGAFWEPFGMKEGCLGGERALAQPF